MPSGRSSAFFSRSARVQLRLFFALFLLIPNRRAGTGFTVPVAPGRARALEIAQTARRMIARKKIALISLSIKENGYATA